MFLEQLKTNQQKQGDKPINLKQVAAMVHVLHSLFQLSQSLCFNLLLQEEHPHSNLMFCSIHRQLLGVIGLLNLGQCRDIGCCCCSGWLNRWPRPTTTGPLTAHILQLKYSSENNNELEIELNTTITTNFNKNSHLKNVCSVLHLIAQII